MDLGLRGAVAVISGGSKGMGRATAELMAEEGARVAILARGKEALDETAGVLEDKGAADVVALSVDVRQPEQITDAFRQLGDRWGEINALVNTVGPADGRFEDLSDEDWDRTMDLGLMSAVRCTRAALPLLRAADWARIVNVSAHSIQRQNPTLTAYTASKAALTSLSKNLAKTLAPDGIIVNTVSPGTFVTAAFTEALQPFLDEAGLDASDPHDVMKWIDDVYHQPADLGRAGLPEEIGAVITFLASKRNSYATGANVNVDGGSDFV